MMSVAARLDEWPRPAWIALVILAFVFWWPLGLVIATYLAWSGKMWCCGIGFGDRRGDTHHRAQELRHPPQPSGSRAFDEYRTATLRRLEEEQGEFREFLSRLRTAKDKAEFDQFMGERRARPEPQQA
jgi:hypothetical protein